ncbi:MAG: DNA-deoxyinosine glycosylase [Pseudomonadales bacterium]|nr:DNA-deoxyinosine glycosylase [Pseudomonadales bacterium]
MNADALPLTGFPAVHGLDARILILGSMPGAASLRAGEYYAHPRNAFWPIMGALFGATPMLPYAERIRVLGEAGIVLWDVLQSCVRPGSLDADIESLSVQINDFPALFARHPDIKWVFFNGSAAERYFRGHVLPKLMHLSLHCRRLPSTSPAHAALSYTQKLAAWRCVREAPGAGKPPLL